MVLKEWYKKYENCILASGLLLLLLLFVGIRYDYYYELNDDVLMKDLMAGVYTGEPEGHNIQVMYPLSLAVSLIYRLLPKAPVYGIFLCLCQYGCLWLIVKRSFCFCRRTGKKLLLAAAEECIICGLFLEHLVFVQYSVTAALLSAAAAFLFVTSQRKEKTGGFVRKNIGSVLLAVLSFQLRSEMMELLLPLICAAGVYSWCREEKIFTKENYKKYFTVFGLILAGMAVSWGINRAAFAGGDWKAYVDFFNSRTELYDFQGIPSYEGNEAFYKELGLAKEEQYMLLDQYNFGLEETLDTAVLDAVTQYQSALRSDGEKFGDILKEKLFLYRYRIFHKGQTDSGLPCDYPWNYMVILGYAAVFLVGMKKNVPKGREGLCRMGKNTGCLFFMLAVRTALWMFLLIRGRDPVRITHSLYLMEFCILMAMLFMEGAGEIEKEQPRSGWFGGAAKEAGFAGIAAVILTLTAVLAMSEAVAGSDKNFQDRERANGVYESMKEYGRAHGECFYFQDVYSAVSYPEEPYAGTPYSEKLFGKTDNSLANYDIMGGWLVKSPSQKKKLELFGIDSMQEGLLYHENVYMMAELDKGTDYIRDYFKAQGIGVEVEQTDEICGIIGVYRIRTK
ncbi:MAG TPA: hypothetical protein DCZ40_03055 [Lachnospiraceae bacterium]|nr:hypothetical protein [Lachnospiraceae bacterium]